ncbi:MAG: TonB-dependent receptor [Pedobacter sp.]|nr:TonB-dependent receptor [Pedobacter sp.]
MIKSLLTKIVVLLFVFVGSIAAVNAQVTTSTLTGTIKDAKGALPGAGIKATHTPTGTVYSFTTNAEGRFNISNMRVGGPYTIELSYVGYQAEKVTDIFLKLGEPYVLNVVLTDNSSQLTEVVVNAKRDGTFSSKKTGASTNISKEQLQNLPSLSRSLQDFTRLTPQANGNNFGGINNRFNGLTIDGAVNNDAFGLGSTGAPGGQAATNPISLDAIQEIQVVLAPFDVTNANAVGGGINAVTRSGTNKVEGSAYVFNRNENITGKSIDGLNSKALPFHNTTYGFRLGSPIVKDKLFIFVNAERQNIVQPTINNAGDNNAISLDEVQRIAKVAADRYGYNVGGTGPFDTETQNTKIFARLDWNINAKNQLTIRHNYIKAYDDKLTRNTNAFSFASNLYRFNDVQNNSVLELRSAITPNISNNLIVGYSRIRDDRSAEGTLFPQIRIGGLTGSRTATFGSEAASTANELDQDIFEFTDNVKIFANKHTFTFGTHNEFYKIRNLFINNLAGAYTWGSLDKFETNTKPQANTSTSKIPGDLRPAARFSAAQLGFYFQDEIDAFPGFKLIAGLKADVPLIFDTPLSNPKVNASFPGYRTDQVPSGQILISPRLSFNWDLTGDRSIQLRGGSGILSSRAPFVWISNQFSNTGLLTSAVNAAEGTGTFIPDVNNQTAAGGVAGTTSEINLISQNFKLPQVFRSNLAVDFKLPGGVQATLEALYTQTINNINYRNLNIKQSVASINPALTGGADKRPLYTNTSASGRVNGTDFTNVYLIENTRQGSAYSLTAQLQKSFNMGLFVSGAYTYGEAEDTNSGFSSTAGSGFGGVFISGNPANPPLTYSNYDLRHRVIGSLNYAVRYGKNKASATTLSLFYVGKSGSPFSYYYNGDLNGDNSQSSGNTGNDLIYIPRSSSEIKLVTIPAVTTGTTPSPAISPADQWTALDNYINNDPYLSSRRGQYARRNAARMPWEHQFDARIMQDLGVVFKGSKNTLQLSFDIINVGNLLNKDWGRQYSINNSAYALINYSTANGGGYTFRAPTTGVAYGESPFASRWQGQVGLRYNFN